MTQMQKLCRMAAAEGAVLLKNEKNALPIREGETVSIFGRIQLNYYKSGTGSGGLAPALLGSTDTMGTLSLLLDIYSCLWDRRVHR